MRLLLLKQLAEAGLLTAATVEQTAGGWLVKVSKASGEGEYVTLASRVTKLKVYHRIDAALSDVRRLGFHSTTVEMVDSPTESAA